MCVGWPGGVRPFDGQEVHAHQARAAAHQPAGALGGERHVVGGEGHLGAAPERRVARLEQDAGVAGAQAGVFQVLGFDAAR
ncbi:MAG: hypothetical protein NVSMB32_18580 [Actinomycetota bacterium]